MSLNGRAAIAGLGITEQGKVYDHNHVGFAAKRCAWRSTTPA